MAFDAKTVIARFPSLAPKDDLDPAQVAAANAVAQGYIDGALGMAEAYCDRYFMRKAVGAVFHYPADTAYSLKRYPINKILSISLRDSDSGKVTRSLKSGEYQIHRQAGLILTCGFGAGGCGSCGGGGNEVVIEYDGGYDTLPPALETALFMIVGDLLEQREQFDANAMDLAFDKLVRVSVPDVGTMSFNTDRNLTGGSYGGRAFGLIPGAAQDILNLFKRYEA